MAAGRILISIAGFAGFSLGKKSLRIEYDKFGIIRCDSRRQFMDKPRQFSAFLTLVIPADKITDVFAGRAIQTGFLCLGLDEALKLTRESDIHAFGHMRILTYVPQNVKFVGHP